MNVVVEDKLGVAVVRIRENVTFSNTHELKDVLDGAVAAGSGGMVIDLERVSFINSTGIGLIASAFNKLKQRGAHLVLLKPRPEVSRVLKIIGFDTMMKISDDEQKALDLTR